MSISLYDAVVRTYAQFLPGVEQCLQKGREHFESLGRDPNALVDSRIYPDMLPLHFQIVTLVHMSTGAVRTVGESGIFGAPDLTLSFDYAGLQGHVREARAEIEAVDAAEFDDLAGGTVTFRAGDVTLRFTTEDFFLSFCVPHFYFHTTTAYDLLRLAGVPLGKADFLGAARTLPDPS